MPYPGDKVIGYEPWDDEAAELNRDFATYHWRGLPRDVLAYHSGKSPFLSKKGKQFYLPAYLLGAIDDFASTLDSTVYCLAPYANIEWAYSDYDLYTKAQRDVIRHFLEYVRDAMPHVTIGDVAQRALDQYWSKGEP